MKTEKTKRRLTPAEMAYTALLAALIAVCAWICIPGPVPFTLQTLGVFLALGLLGGRLGTCCVGLYIILGAVGLPVFSGFSGGIGSLVGPTGGYIVGFLCAGLVYWLVTALAGEKLWACALGMVLGLVVCYAFGTVWFTVVYSKASGPIGFFAALAKCVLPFVLPDAGKIALALFLTRVLKKHMRLRAQ